MIYRLMDLADIENVIPLYIEYYNKHEDGVAKFIGEVYKISNGIVE